MKSRSRARTRSRKGRSRKVTRSRRFRKGNRAVTNLVRQPVFADRCMVKLPYADDYAFTGTNFQAQNFKLNSAFDFDSTGVGHQPLGYDQYAAFYRKYKVHAVKLIMTWVSSITTSPTYVCAYVSASSPTLSDVPIIYEQPYATVRTLSQAGGVSTLTYKKFINIAKFLGIKKSADNEDLEATTTSDPAQLVYLGTGCQLPGGGSVSCNLMIKAYFYIEFFDRITLAQS